MMPDNTLPISAGSGVMHRSDCLMLLETSTERLPVQSRETTIEGSFANAGLASQRARAVSPLRRTGPVNTALKIVRQ
jgi:hypothetical protein